MFFANWHSPATLTEGFPCFFLRCKTNASTLRVAPYYTWLNGLTNWLFDINRLSAVLPQAILFGFFSLQQL
jgi:hypothetical protein